MQWEDLKLFEREANVLKQLDYPRIPKYRDYFSIDDRSLWFGLVQEYIQGDSLREYIAKGHKFVESEVKQIAIAILKILIYLHELSPQVLHRDIKPSNLILTKNEGEARNIYLVDFGAVQDKASSEGKSFTVVGTYGYAPMEQYGGRTVAASDLYALGATMIHLLTGLSPADLPQDDDAKIVFSDRTSASPHLVQWIQKLVEPTVKKRYPSARIALQALSEPPKTSTAQPVVSVPAKPAKRSLFGKTYWQAKFLTTELHRVEPKWKMIQKRNNGLLDDLIWTGSDHNEDNSTKSNVILVLQSTVHVLAAHDIRPTEVNWLIDVIEEFLDQSRRK